MKIQPYIKKLSSSDQFSSFKRNHPDAFLVAGFFILDLESGKNMHQIDYYVPKEKKIAAFSLDDKVTIQLLDAVGEKLPEKLDIKTKIDLDELRGILEDEMKNRSITEEIKKIIAIVQNIEGKKIWNLNCVLSGLEILRAHVEDDSKTILKMEKASILDFIKTVPMKGLKGMDGNAKALNTKPEVKSGKEELTKELQALDKLKDEIEREAAEIKKQIGTQGSNKEKAKTIIDKRRN